MNIVETVNGISLRDVINTPAEYNDEVLGAAIETLNEYSRQLREAKVRLEGHLAHSMKQDGATKLIFMSADGSQRKLTLNKGKMEASTDADEIYKKHGFDPLEIGEYKYVASWSKAKEARKLGGEKQLVIDEIFKEGKEKLTIT